MGMEKRIESSHIKKVEQWLSGLGMTQKEVRKIAPIFLAHS